MSPPLRGKPVSFASPISDSWAKFALANIAELVPLHPDLRDEDAAGLIVNPISAAAMFGEAREHRVKSFVATAGGAQLGKFLITLVRENDCRCIAIVRRAELVAPLRELGALDVLTTGEFTSQLRSLEVAHKPGVLLDPVADHVAADPFFAMPNHAAWVILGWLAMTPPKLLELQQYIVANKQIRGFWLTTCFQRPSPVEIAQVIGDVRERFVSGRWRTNIIEKVPLKDAMARRPTAASQKDGKVLLAM